MKKELKVNEVEIVNGTPVVRGQFGDAAFEAAPFRWGSKMLMKVTGGDFDRGTRIAIGHAAKKALKAAGIPLPEAVLKRPRKIKVEVVSSSSSEVADDGPVPEIEIMTLDQAVEALEA